MRHVMALGMRRYVSPVSEGHSARGGGVLGGGPFSCKLTRQVVVL
jgi:hypothetical protein